MAEPKYSIDRIRGEMRPLNSMGGVTSEIIDYYFDFYGLSPEKQIEGVEHSFGTFDSEGYTLAAHIYRRENAKATVVLMHGYMNHCGQLKHLIRYLLERGYAVCAYDMPGHGLSSGKAAWMDDFGTYAKVMEDFKGVVAEHCGGPYYVTGFSHGVCPIVQELLEGKEDFFEKTILVAPLIRPVHWKYAQFTYRLYWPFRDSVPRISTKNTSDQDELVFNRTLDFLHKRRVPLMWVRGLERWNGKVNSMEAVDKKVLIIQGDRDGTVDWKYNTKFLGKKFDTTEIILKGGRHELFNECAEIKGRVLDEIGSYLGSNLYEGRE